MKPMHTKPEKIYVKVDSTFDATGYMQPTSITWADGRTFPIEKVRDFRPAGTADNSCSGDCFTVLIQGQEKSSPAHTPMIRHGSSFRKWLTVWCYSLRTRGWLQIL